MLGYNESVNKIRNEVLHRFKQSGKKNLIITGSRGIGKTTLLNAILKHLKFSENYDEIFGIITKLDTDDSGCKKIILSSTTNDHWHTMAVFENGKPNINADAWNMIAVSCLKEVVALDSELIFIDEIGFVELGFELYLNEIARAFTKKRVIAVLRKMDSDFHIELKLRDDVYVIDMDDYRIRR